MNCPLAAWARRGGQLANCPYNYSVGPSIPKRRHSSSARTTMPLSDHRVAASGQGGLKMIQTAVASAIAFKEWAVTVQALATGQQILMVRKGGIHQEDKNFRMEHAGFFLYPTYEHQRADLLQPPYRPALDAILATPPAADRVRLEYWAEVTDVYETLEPAEVEALAPLHILTT